MAQQNDSTAARGRIPLLAALVAFAAATAVAFGRVYQGPGMTGKLVLAAAGAVLAAAALERFHVLLSTLGSAAGLLLALGLLVFPETTAYGLPTGETLRAIAVAFEVVGGVAARTVAPVGPIPALLLAGVVAVWTASFAAHALVARAASGVLALLPAGALVGFADVVLEDGIRPAYMVLFLLTGFAVLSTLGLRSVARWGHLVPWSGAPRWSLFSTNALRAARRAAIPAALSAILLPWTLPGLHAPAWYPIGGAGAGGQVSIDPIVDLRPSLALDPARELFTVETPRPAYWRMVALDRFDGQRWFSTDPRAEGGEPLPVDGMLRPSAQFDLAEYTTLRVNVDIDALSSLWLPLPYETSFVDVTAEDPRYDAELSTVVIPELTDDDLTYRAVGALVSPQPSQIDDPFDTRDPLYRVGSPFLELPAGLPPQIGRIANRITRNHPTPYRKTLAIQNHLRTFTYDERAQPGHGANHLVNFLTETQRGYCEQFAGAMAVMLRAVGIPSRVVIGFTPGTFDPDDRRYHVTTRNAHAWVEVHMGEYGWLAFEPTPSRLNPTADSFQFPVQLPGGEPPPGVTRDPRNPGSARTAAGQREPQVGVGPGETPPPATRVSPVALGTVAGATILVLVLAAIPLAKLVSRRRVVARASGPRARVLAAYEVFGRRMADLGFGRRGAETLWEFRARLQEGLRFPEGRLERLTRLAGRAAYGGAELSPEEAGEAVAIAAAIAREAERGVGRRRRALALWRLGRRPSAAPRPAARRAAVAWSPAALPS